MRKSKSCFREQNTWTIKTVTSALLEDKTAFIETMEQWATLVAKSRVESDTPIYEVLEALNKVRETYWAFITDYMLMDTKITKRNNHPVEPAY
ncbi:hypothetical protein RCO48_00715 [Peribacillus frigoritolerans]|nr:hypothetical protein [Peribacillus frigoritolerans]